MPEQISADEFLEREAGGSHHRAVLIAELQSTAEAAAEEFKYDEGQGEFVALCQRLAKWEPVKFDA